MMDPDLIINCKKTSMKDWSGEVTIFAVKTSFVSVLAYVVAVDVSSAEPPPTPVGSGTYVKTECMLSLLAFMVSVYVNPSGTVTSIGSR